jgi:hypothetical protein
MARNKQTRISLKCIEPIPEVKGHLRGKRFFSFRSNAPATALTCPKFTVVVTDNALLGREQGNVEVQEHISPSLFAVAVFVAWQEEYENCGNQ